MVVTQHRCASTRAVVGLGLGLLLVPLPVGCLAAAGPVLGVPHPHVALERWLPVNGTWTTEGEQFCELSDSADSGDTPFWAIAGQRHWSNYRFGVAVEARDGVGSLFTAIRWQNRENHYALEASDPGGSLRLLLVRDGRETELATVAKAFALGPGRDPVSFVLEGSGPVLRAYVDGKMLLETVDFTFASGLVAVGEKNRRAVFGDFRLAWTQAEVPARMPKLEYSGERRVFVRGEEGVSCLVTVSNAGSEALSGATLRVSMDGLLPRDSALDALEPGADAKVTYPVDTAALREGEYALCCDVREATGRTLASQRFPVWIAARPNPQRFDVLLWGSLGTDEAAMATMQRLGVTSRAVLLFFSERLATFELSPNVIAGADAGQRFGLGGTVRVSTSRILSDETAMVLGVGGKPQLKRHPLNCPNHTQVRERIDEAIDVLGEALERLPGLRFVLLNTETENEERQLAPCRHPGCVERAQQELGMPIPEGLERGWSVVGAPFWKDPAAFGVGDTGIVDDADPYYRFLKWWWQAGSGFVDANQRVSDRLKQHVPHLQTFHDPVLRCPAFLGRCRGLDIVSQWTYTYPSPLGIAQNADELLAVATDRHAVCQTIQFFWYKGAAVGTPTPEKDTTKTDAPVFATDADAWGSYITISPAHLRESVWLALSRPVRMLQFGGSSAICDRPGSYDFTNRDTPQELERLAAELIRPYGPMLREMQSAPRSVAVLSSAASGLFGRTGSFGNTSSAFADWHKAVLLAQLQPHIVLDETVTQGALDGVNVLIVPPCKALPRAVHERVCAFAAAGGTVIADPVLVPSIPNVRRLDFPETKGMTAVAAQAAWVAAGRALDELLRSAGHKWPVWSSSPDVVIATRAGHGARCLFVINDRRCAGPYVGRHGLILDAGVAQETDLFLDAARYAEGVLYDVALRRELQLQRDRDVLKASLLLPPAGGRMLYWSPERLHGVTVRVASAPARPGCAELRVEVMGAEGNPVRGAIPLAVELRDSAGRRDARSGWYCAVDGALDIRVPLALNDRAGAWWVHVEELLAGHRAEAAFTVQ